MAVPEANRPRRLAVVCAAAIAAALFTPVPTGSWANAVTRVPAAEAQMASATLAEGLAGRGPAIALSAAASSDTVPVTALPPAPSRQFLAQSLISTGMIGLGLALTGLIIVAHRRRQW